MDRITLHNMDRPDDRDLWACAYAAAMNFLHGGEDGLGEGRGMYGPGQAITYEYGRGDGPALELAVWRNSEGVNVAPVDEGS
ncbi:hypothetical protein [Halofilum ochraceum]|uniref:hypothetical protein n=1 Tax=Halofilum ochraceum TaxID=1611323 RepID=UPI0008DAABC6|nr:hypothetical protein [Halofilum ochraceum]